MKGNLAVTRHGARAAKRGVGGVVRSGKKAEGMLKRSGS